MDRETFQQGMSYLAAAYDLELNMERLAVFWDQLGGLQDEHFLEAVKELVGHCPRFPSVAQIREAYRAALRRRTERESAKVVMLPGSRADRERVKRLVRRIRKSLR